MSLDADGAPRCANSGAELRHLAIRGGFERDVHSRLATSAAYAGERILAVDNRGSRALSARGVWEMAVVAGGGGDVTVGTRARQWLQQSMGAAPAVRFGISVGLGVKVAVVVDHVVRRAVACRHECCVEIGSAPSRP